MIPSKDFKLIPAAILLLRKSDTVFLSRRQNTGWADGMYNLPGGHTENNETIFDAIIREAKEEVGIKLKKENLEVVHILHRKSEVARREYLAFIVQANFWEGEPYNAEPDKCDHADWFSLNNLPQNIIDGHECALKQIAQKQMYSEHNWDFPEEKRIVKPNDRFALASYVTIQLRKNNTILVAHRFNTSSSDGSYYLTGGKIDGNEPLFQTAIRKAREELGIDLKKEMIKLIHVTHVNANGKQTLDFYIEATEWAGEPVNKEPHKCDEITWFDQDTLPENLVYIQKRVFALLKKNIFYSEIGW